MLHKLEFGSKGNLIFIFLAKLKSLQLYFAARRNMLHKNHVLLQLTYGQVQRAVAFTSALHWTCSPTGREELARQYLQNVAEILLRWAGTTRRRYGS